MLPVIKWPGGKRREMKKILGNLPKKFEYIVEPFFGGGAFSLHLVDEHKILGADIDLDLVNFYHSIKKKTFLNKVKKFANWWDSDQSICDFPIKTIKLQWDSISERNKKTIKHHLYYAVRKRYNKLKLSDIYNEERALAFFIMRELSFSSMFRFNSLGEFNVPYGGLAYNKKSFKNKYHSLIELSEKKFDIEHSDFHQIVENHKHNNKALIFLDPPYDSVFKDYNSNSFGKKDQIRLRDSLINSKANILMIINDTPFIRGLYENNGFNIEAYQKQYSVNFKNRNGQKVSHLVIKNY